MQVRAIDWRVVSWRMDGRGAARGRRTRTALFVEVVGEGGERGVGEAAPLEGMSVETLDDARDAIAAIAARVPGAIDVEEIEVASARFAIETAIDVARRRAIGGEVPVAVVVESAEEARAAWARGVTHLKVKGVDRVRAIAEAAPGARLRLDLNRGWERGEVKARLGELVGLPIEFVEEPCEGAAELVDEALAVKIALDESLARMTRAEIARAVRGRALGAVVLKPTLLGGVRVAAAIADKARAQGVRAIVSHALEGPVAMAACVGLARTLGDEIAGLAPHAGLAAWREGAGTTLREVLGRVDDPLVPEPRVVGGRRARVIVAVPGIETIGAIRDALAARAPIAIVHPGRDPAEQARQREVVERAKLPADAAVVLFTSGSTATPRGVVLSRAALIAAADASAAHLGWRDDDRWLLALSTAHAGGLAVVIRCLIARRPIEVTGRSIAEALARCTLASLVPAQLAGLLDDEGWRPPARLRAVLLGGAPASDALLARAAARGVPFLTTYGMTESFGQLATAPVARAGEVGAPLVALPGVELEAGTCAEPAPIRARGPMLATCYLDGEPIGRELVTRDLGFIEDGAVTVVGRVDDVIVTGGHKVHPTAIEAVVAATAGVRAACAFGVADERWGQRIAVALAVGPAFDAAAAARAWHDALPAHARPRELAIAAQLPALATGKLDRRAAAELPRIAVRYA